MTQDSFTILELISQSSTTSVYKAHQNVLDRIVLLKVLHKHLLRDKDLIARFTREAKACAILKSDNIVQVYDLTDVDGAPAIVMEFVEGKSLEDLLVDAGVRSEELLLKVATSVLRALSFAHESGVTHRDIKPGNILVSESGAIKVTDFGLAAVADAPSLTMEGSLIGTPAYMSPEQARGEAVDNRTDLFSLGITLVEVLTGDKILAGRSYAECINKIQSFDLESIQYLAPRCSPHVYEFLKKLLAPDKNDRFASAGEALEFLGPGAVGAEIKPESATRRSGRTRNVLLAGAVAAVLILVVGLSFVFKHPSQKSSDIVPDSTAAVGIEPAAVKESGPAEKKSSPAEKDSGEKDGMKSAGDVATAKKDSIGISRAVGETVASAQVGSDSGYISIHCTPWAI